MSIQDVTQYTFILCGLIYKKILSNLKTLYNSNRYTIRTVFINIILPLMFPIILINKIMKELKYIYLEGISYEHLSTDILLGTLLYYLWKFIYANYLKNKDIKQTTYVLTDGLYSDSGKGKLMSYLIKEIHPDIVVRCNASTNASHCVPVMNNKTENILVTKQLPSVFNCTNELLLISPGAILNINELLQELKNRPDIGTLKNRIKIANTINLILPGYIEKNRSDPNAKMMGSLNQGTTLALVSRTAKHALHLYDLTHNVGEPVNLNLVSDIMNKISRSYEALNINADKEQVERDANELINAYADIYNLVGNFSIDYSNFMNQNKDKKFLVEGCNGMMIDNIHGSVPYVTSCMTTIGAMLAYCNISPFKLHTSYVAYTAYTCCVNKRPFPTEISDEQIKNHIYSKCNETDNAEMIKRRIGWCDLVTMRKTLNGSTGSKIFINKLDPLCGLKNVQVCVKYDYEGILYDVMPDSPTVTGFVKPIYKIFDGWNTCADQNCKIFMDFLCSEITKTGSTVIGFGTGPYSNDIIFV